MRPIRGVRTRLAGCVLAVTALVATLVVAPLPARAAPPVDPSQWDVAPLSLPNRFVAYDDTRDALLVAVHDTLPVLGNHLVEVDLASGAIGRSVWVGSIPRQVVVADDGSRAYVALAGVSRVIEVNLTTFEIERIIELDEVGTSDSARFMAVQPGAANVLAVQRGEIAIYEDGTKRPGTVDATHPDSFGLLTWGESPTTLFYYDASNISDDYFRLSVSDSGLALVDSAQALGGNTSSIVLAGGYLHASTGAVIDPATLTKIAAYERSGRLAIDAATNTTYFLSGTSLSSNDAITYAHEWDLPVPNITPRQIVVAGEYLVAAGNDGLLVMGGDVSLDEFSPPPAPEIVQQGWDRRELDYRAVDIAASPDEQHVFALRSSTAGEFADSLVEIDLRSGKVTRSVHVGNEPRTLAVSDDGAHVLIGHGALNILTEVAVADFRVTGVINITPLRYATDIVAVPNDPTAFVVELSAGTSSYLRVYRGGTALPSNASTFPAIESFAFDGDASRLYSLGGDEIDRWAVVESGIESTGPSVRVSVIGPPLTAHNGLLYSASGTVIEAAHPRPIGHFEPATNPAGIPLVVPEFRRMFFARGGSVSEYDLDEHWRVGGSYHGGTLEDLILVGSNLVTRAGNNKLFVTPLMAEDPRTPPDAVSEVVAKAAHASAIVSWQVPHEGGAPIDNYTATAYPGGATCSTATTFCTVTGLTIGTTYTFTVVATNVKGDSAASAPSAPIIAAGPQSEPLNLVVTPLDGSLALSWQPPDDDGGSPITSYVGFATPGSHTCTVAVTTCNLTNLINGVPYAVTVSATNAIGPGPTTESVVATPTTCGTDGTPPFIDVGTTHLFCVDIEWLVGHHIAEGYLDGTFRPTTSVSRQVIAAMLYRLHGSPAFALPDEPTFTDVPFEHIFAVAIEWAAANDIVLGFPDGAFRPTQVVSRQVLAALLYRLAGSPLFSQPLVPSFTDVGPAQLFFKEIEWLASVGVGAGYNDGTFRPKQHVSRQALAAFLYRFSTRE